MTKQNEFSFNQLSRVDLIVDAIYRSGTNGNAGDDPISKIIKCGNQGGFRFVGSIGKPDYCILYSDMTQPDWPDYVDIESGIFTYFGDNRRPGHEIHETHKGGNLILKTIYNHLHEGRRENIPPIFVFTKGPERRDVIFRGLAVPGVMSVNQTEDLVAIWKTTDNQRFQNYKALFTILDIPIIQRKWIDNLQNKQDGNLNAPLAWLDFLKNGVYKPLIAPRTLHVRSITEQLPSSGIETEIVSNIINYFHNHPQGAYAFEKCAAEIAMMMDRNIASYTLTRPWRDGGRDAMGEYIIGLDSNAIKVEYSLEAKCYSLNNGCGVKQTTRLISRLRFRQFGIFVTTSYIDSQAYAEIIEDQHPVLIITGKDIARILINGGYNSQEAIQKWLSAICPYA